MKNLTMLEFTDEDLEVAKQIAYRICHRWTVYSSTSDIIGLFCEKAFYTNASLAIIKTKEFGFMVVQDMEDLCLEDLMKELA
jgi:hypothetical protein